MKAPKAVKMLARMRKLCLALPEADEGGSFGNPVWRVGKKTFAMLYDLGKGLTASFWVGIERQGPLEMDPRFSIPAYMGHNGWIALDVSQPVSDAELRSLVIESYRHFATRRAIARLEAQSE
jgi:predicted DNA-binding protein (MmcQ/YjbR family)